MTIRNMHENAAKVEPGQGGPWETCWRTYIHASRYVRRSQYFASRTGTQ